MYNVLYVQYTITYSIYVRMYVRTYVRVYVRTVRMSDNAVALLHTTLAMPSKCTENSKHLMGGMSNWARYGCTHIRTNVGTYVCMYVRVRLLQKERHMKQIGTRKGRGSTK